MNELQRKVWQMATVVRLADEGAYALLISLVVRGAA